MKAVKWILIGTLFAIAFAGCYTKLVHPPVTDEAGTSYHPRKHCSDCHSSADYYYYHFPYYYNRWGGRYWNSYYTTPWWYHDYWWWDGDDGEGLPVGETRYYDQRERPGTAPKLVPPAGGSTGTGDQVPSLPDGSGGSEIKEKPKTDNSGSEYYQPRTRPEQPKEEPKEVKKEEKKAKEKK